MGHTDDDILLAKLRKRSERDEGFSLLMNKYKQRVYWHIRRMVVSHCDAEDVLQETFINVYRFIDKFDGKSAIYTWIYRIATNECLRHFRNNKLQTDSLTEDSRDLLDTLQSEVDVSQDEIVTRFKEAILRLPRRQQLVFNMRYYDDMSYEEIAQVLDCSVATLKTNYHYAKEKITAYIQESE